MEFKKTRPTLAIARQKAEKYCAYQERSHKEVKQKLMGMGLTMEEADDILIHLIQHKFLNEERYAHAFAGGKFRTKKWGRKKIVYQMKAKGINDKLIAEALTEIKAQDYTQTIQELILKKDKALKETDIYKKSAAITRYLITKGYEMELTVEMIKKYYNL
jgi:regulatory protein